MSCYTTATKPASVLRDLIRGMRAAYAQGENAMEFARRAAGSNLNEKEATLLAYDLQAGSYIARVRNDPEAAQRWAGQLADVLRSVVSPRGSILEVGCGEATTLAGVLQRIPIVPEAALGFDISWSRCAEARAWLEAQGVAARVFVADLFAIPLADASIDVVYTSHSLEPNGGREEAALRELLRVARNAVVLFEPIYELGAPEAQARMQHHGYVRGLRAALERIGATVTDHRLLPYAPNPLNPSGVIVVQKESANCGPASGFQCPVTHAPLCDDGDVFVSVETGLAYPVMRGIPLLRAEHAVVASRLAMRRGDEPANSRVDASAANRASALCSR